MENPIKMDDLGVPLFLETPTWPPKTLATVPPLLARPFRMPSAPAVPQAPRLSRPSPPHRPRRPPANGPGYGPQKTGLVEAPRGFERTNFKIMCVCVYI